MRTERGIDTAVIGIAVIGCDTVAEEGHLQRLFAREQKGLLLACDEPVIPVKREFSYKGFNSFDCQSLGLPEQDKLFTVCSGGIVPIAERCVNGCGFGAVGVADENFFCFRRFTVCQEVIASCDFCSALLQFVPKSIHRTHNIARCTLGVNDFIVAFAPDREDKSLHDCIRNGVCGAFRYGLRFGFLFGFIPDRHRSPTGEQ